MNEVRNKCYENKKTVKKMEVWNIQAGFLYAFCYN